MNKTVSDVLVLVTYGKANRATTKTIFQCPEIGYFKYFVNLGYILFDFDTKKGKNVITLGPSCFLLQLSSRDSAQEVVAECVVGSDAQASKTTGQTSVREARARYHPHPTKSIIKSMLHMSNAIMKIWVWVGRRKSPLRYTKLYMYTDLCLA